MLDAPCLLGMPAQPESVLSVDSAMLVGVRGSLVFTGKHKKQRKVPKRLTQKEALFPGARVYCKAQTWDLRCHELH